MNIYVNNIFVRAVEALGEHALKIGCGFFVTVATVINAGGIFVLTGKKGVGNGIGTCKYSLLRKRKEEGNLVPEGIAHFARRLKEGFYLRIFLIA